MSQFPGPTANSFLSQRLRLHYVEWGDRDAPPLILQHGGRDHCRSWDWAAQELQRDWHVICPDLRGHGDSQWSPEGHYGTNALIYDFAQLIETLGCGPVSVVAHSLGGAIATRFAGLYPEKVARLVNIEGLGPLLSDYPQLKPEAVDARLRRWIAEKRAAAARSPRRYASLAEAEARMREANASLSDERVRHLTIHGAMRNEDGTWSWKYDNYLNVWAIDEQSADDLLRLWQAITCPVLLCYGKESFARSPASDGRLAKLPTARLLEYEQAGHWLHHDQFDQFMADIAAFLAPSETG